MLPDKLLKASDTELVIKLMGEEHYVLSEPFGPMGLSDLLQVGPRSEPAFKVTGDLFNIYKAFIEGKPIPYAGFENVPAHVAQGYSFVLELGYLLPPNYAGGWFIFYKTNQEALDCKATAEELAKITMEEMKSDPNEDEE
jgi:hypothetical protein